SVERERRRTIERPEPTAATPHIGCSRRLAFGLRAALAEQSFQRARDVSLEMGPRSFETLFVEELVVPLPYGIQLLGINLAINERDGLRGTEASRKIRHA